MKMLYFNMVRFGNVNIDEFVCFFFYVHNEMLYTRHIVFSLRDSFPMVLSVKDNNRMIWIVQ